MYKLAASLALVFFVFILWIIFLANTNSSSIFFDVVRSIPYGDKIGHVGLFGVLTLLAIIGLKFRTFAVSSLNVYHGSSAVIVFVIAEELSQVFLPSRTFDLADLAANMLGIALATVFAALGHKYFA